MCPLEAAATGTPIIVTEGGSTDDYFKKILTQIKSEFINSNNGKYLDPNLESLVENISLIIQNPENMEMKIVLNLFETIFHGKK